jgi:hypothetical protein
MHVHTPTHIHLIARLPPLQALLVAQLVSMLLFNGCMMVVAGQPGCRQQLSGKPLPQ